MKPENGSFLIFLHNISCQAENEGVEEGYNKETSMLFVPPTNKRALDKYDSEN